MLPSPPPSFSLKYMSARDCVSISACPSLYLFLSPSTPPPTPLQVSIPSWHHRSILPQRAAPEQNTTRTMFSMPIALCPYLLQELQRKHTNTQDEICHDSFSRKMFIKGGANVRPHVAQGHRARNMSTTNANTGERAEQEEEEWIRTMKRRTGGGKGGGGEIFLLQTKLFEAGKQQNLQLSMITHITHISLLPVFMCR